MKNLLVLAICMSSLFSCSQSNEIAGEYKKLSEDGSIQHLLKLYPNGTFHFESHAVRQVEGKVLLRNGRTSSDTSTGSGLSGRGLWTAENDVIYFSADRETDIAHNYTLNFNDSKAKFTSESSEPSSEKNAIAKLKFLKSDIFWVNGIELEKRN